MRCMYALKEQYNKNWVPYKRNSETRIECPIKGTVKQELSAHCPIKGTVKQELSALLKEQCNNNWVPYFGKTPIMSGPFWTGEMVRRKFYNFVEDIFEHLLTSQTWQWLREYWRAKEQCDKYYDHYFFFFGF